MNRNNKTITITFGDQAENHVGMQKIGEMANTGFNLQDLEIAKTRFEQNGLICSLINLNNYLPEENLDVENAYVLVVRNAINLLLRNINNNADVLFNELAALDWDTKAFMYGRVVNKHARHNLCFDYNSQEPNYQEGRGRIISYNQVPLLNHIKNSLATYIPRSNNLVAEGNFYYDNTKSGIGFHGDSERRKVVAIRLSGNDCPPMHYQWFYQGEPVGNRVIVPLCHGDMYIMSSKAVGTDWKKKNYYTLRHATGCEKFTNI